MIQKVEMYTVICDGCGNTPDCCEFDDNDNLILK